MDTSSPRQQQTPRAYKHELDQSQGHGLGQGSQDGLGRSVGHDRGRVPNGTEELGPKSKHENAFVFELQRTMSRPDTGALRASAISWAFWLTLPLRPRTVRIASLKLFCLPCRPTAPPALGVQPFVVCEPLRACQRSLLCRWFGSPSGCGIGDAGVGS